MRTAWLPPGSTFDGDDEDGMTCTFFEYGGYWYYKLQVFAEPLNYGPLTVRVWIDFEGRW